MLSYYSQPEMPQTVPSAGYTPPCDYNQYFADLDLFDLSLLPDPCEPPSPQGMSFYGQQGGSPGDQPPPPVIKEEPLGWGAAPPPPPPVSPPFQQCPSPSPSAATTVKVEEQSFDLRAALQEHHALLQQVKQEEMQHHQQVHRSPPPPPPQPVMFEPQPGPSSAPVPPVQSPCPAPSDDHKLLREFLRDPSFQKKYNLRPFEFAGLGSGFVSEERLDLPSALGMGGDRMEPVLRLAFEQLRRDVNNSCVQLGISPDPVTWSVEDVKKWLVWALNQYSLPMVNMEYFEMDGAALVQLTEADFQQRAPHSGSSLHAQLEVWKVMCQEVEAVAGPSGSGLTSVPPPQQGVSWNNGSSGNVSCSSSSAGDASDDDDDESDIPTPPSAGAPSPSQGGGKAPSRAQGASGSGSHIHLWQFLKELLASPQLHGSCIRWLDRSKGVFKIEDSVRVARLWGKRKNRPAMNYDKLSRSIRQYYKKGIMKKTERSQRLVYQFCHPYCL